VEKKNSLKTVDDDLALENREYKPTAIGFDQSFFGSADIKIHQVNLLLNFNVAERYTVTI